MPQRLLATLLLVAACAGRPRAAATPAPTSLDPRLSPLGFLVGDWAGEGGGEIGPCTTSAVFAPEAGGHVLVRRSTTVYADGRHEDLLVVWPEAAGLRAAYFDGDGHIIHYAVAVDATGPAAVLDSDEAPEAPRFRLALRRGAGGELTSLFEIGLPGAEMKTHVDLTLHRR